MPPFVPPPSDQGQQAAITLRTAATIEQAAECRQHPTGTAYAAAMAVCIRGPERGRARKKIATRVQMLGRGKRRGGVMVGVPTRLPESCKCVGWQVRGRPPPPNVSPMQSDSGRGEVRRVGEGGSDL